MSHVDALFVHDCARRDVERYGKAIAAVLTSSGRARAAAIAALEVLDREARARWLPPRRPHLFVHELDDEPIPQVAAALDLSRSACRR